MTAPNQLGEFLRARRSRRQPSDGGLPSGVGLRRTPGLRREELAAVAGVSIDYYIRLEQGKETNPSGPILDGLARALQLNEEEQAHLYVLANQALLSMIANGEQTPGRLVAVTDEALLADQRLVARLEGSFICPEGAACVTAVRQLRESGWLSESGQVVVLNTGTGLIYPDTVTVDAPVLPPSGSIPARPPVL